MNRTPRRGHFAFIAEPSKFLHGLTQEELAAKVEITQSQLSKLERREDHRISTLRRYVKAIGGELEVIAVVHGKRIKLAEG